MDYNSKIKELRDRTGQDIRFCKVALEYANNDVEKAMDILHYATTKYLTWSKFLEKFGKKEN